jgi:hypothetical protein
LSFFTPDRGCSKINLDINGIPIGKSPLTAKEIKQ